ncbi:MAG: response regulator [Archangiaceae bacterium]|nr:response regulator [Archangiaceae bacterium]
MPVGEDSIELETAVRVAVTERANALFWAGAGRAAFSNAALGGLLLAAVREAHKNPLVWLWAALMLAVYGTRLVRGRHFAKQSVDEQRRLSATWRLRAIISATAAGVTWGPGLFLLWRLADARERIFVVAVLSGLVAAVSTLLSALRPAFVGFVTPLWFGLVASLVTTAATLTDLMLAGGSIMLLPLLLRGTQTMHDEFERTIRLTVAQEQMTKALEAARDAALAAARARSDFVSMMSHELRTPLNGVIGLTTLLLDSRLDADQRELASGAHASAEMLVGLINGVLDLSKIDTGKLELDRADFDLAHELEALRAVLSLRAKEKSLFFSIEVDGQVPPCLRGDWFRLRQVLVNLVGNALKFTEQGSVAVQVAVTPIDAGSVRVRFEVKDTGIGMTPAQLERIFQPFVQAEASIARRFGGTGLGLSISERLVSLMGGTLKVESVQGQGSTFSFAVPLELRQVAAPLAVTTGPRSGRVGVCDDNDINLTVAARLVERLGFEVVRAHDGAELLRLVQATPCDLLLLDLQMPGLDGYETLARLREAGVKVPAVALTASASVEERDRALAEGFDAFLTKPLNLSDLTTTLDRLRPSGRPLQAVG